jgi:hypothetical protein
MPIQGTVTAAREPVVVLESFPAKRKISDIIDTGFSGELKFAVASSLVLI